MKKIGKILPVLIAITILFTACGKKEETSATENTKSKTSSVADKKDKKKKTTKSTTKDEKTTKTDSKINSKSRHTKKSKSSHRNTYVNKSKPSSKSKSTSKSKSSSKSVSKTTSTKKSTPKSTVSISSEKKKASSTVTRFLNAARTDDNATMRALSVGLDLDSSSETDSISNDDKKMYTFMENKLKKLTYTILDTKVNGNNATIKVQCKYIDLDAFLKDYLIECVEETLYCENDEESDKICEEILNKKIANYKDIYIVKTLNVPLVKQNGKWLISPVSNQLKDVILCNLYTSLKDF